MGSHAARLLRPPCRAQPETRRLRDHCFVFINVGSRRRRSHLQWRIRCSDDRRNWLALASLIGVAVLAGSLPGPALAADSQTATPTIISTPGSFSLYVADPALYKANGLAKARGGLEHTVIR